MKISTYGEFPESQIQGLYGQTFSDSEGQAEGEVIAALVHDILSETDDADLLGFVATDGNKLVGCILFTRLLFDELIKAFLLSPVAVHSEYQGKGVGQELITFGLAQLEDRGVNLVFTYGDPRYYSRVGFEQISEDVAKAPFTLSQPEGWLAQSLNGEKIEPLKGSSRCVAAFNNSELW